MTWAILDGDDLTKGFESDDQATGKFTIGFRRKYGM
jgi:hypothetical protein|tara:strand:+ start:297 stop:404 length:108 start_codon:yes stop_codon:yes gene_type:complete